MVRDKTMFQLVLKSSRTEPEREREQLLGRRRWWASNQWIWIEVLAEAPSRPNTDLLEFVSHHLTTGLCCEGRLGRVKTFLGVHTSKHKLGQEWINNTSLIPSITISCKWNKQPGHQETESPHSTQQEPWCHTRLVAWFSIRKKRLDQSLSF